MSCTALWTFDDQQLIRPIDANNYGKFNQLQSEVELHDLPQLIGREMLQAIKREPEKYDTLLNGGDYDDNGDTYSFAGLKTVCCFLLYAKYVRQAYISDTFSGMVAHTGEGFARLSNAELQNQESNYRQIAGTAWDDCVAYMVASDIDLLKSNCKTRKRNISAI